MMSAGAVTAALVVLGGWFGVVEGNGHVKPEERKVAAFTGVDFSGGITAEITVGPAQKVTLITDENLLPLLKTRVENGVLTVDHEQTLQPTRGIHVVITVPALDRISGSGGTTIDAKLRKTPKLSLEASGGATLRVAGIDTNQVSIDLSGGVNATLKGTAGDAHIELSGGVKLYADELAVKTAYIDASGGVTAKLAVAEKLSGEASGGVDVKVKGRPALNVDTSGGADVRTN